jgi:hypothetical protein
MHALMSLLVLVAFAQPPETVPCRRSLNVYERGLAEAAFLQGAFTALETRGLHAPESRVVAVALFDRQEQLARELQTSIAAVRRDCGSIEGFDKVDLELQRVEPLLRALESDSRHMKLRLGGGRDA